MNTVAKDAPLAPASAVVEVTDATFVAEVLEAGMPVLVDFMAQWCGPCRFMGPIFAQVAPEYAGRVKFAKVDVDASPEVAAALAITSIPTLALFVGNTAVAAGMGAMRAPQLRQWIDQALTRVPAPDPAGAAASA